jgi:MFS family permease
MSQSSEIQVEQCRPTRARYQIVTLAIALAVVTYTDRVAMSQAAPALTKTFGLTKIQMGWVFSAFTFGYMLFEVPGGWLGDRYGPRNVLLKIVLWWSVFTALTGSARSFVMLLACRFLFGAGEAGCFPNLAKIFRSWLPRDERARIQGLLWLASRWSGAFTPLLAQWIFGLFSWRAAFHLFALLGVAWAIVFSIRFKALPRLDPRVNAAERELIEKDADEASDERVEKIPWRKFLGSPTVWCLWGQYFGVSWGWSFYITWLPTYLHEGRGLDLQQSALLSALPLFCGGFGCMIGGALIPYLGHRGMTHRTARIVLGAFGYLTSGALLLTSINIGAPLRAMVIIGLSSFLQDLALPASWEACIDEGGSHTGSLSGSMNMVGQFAGAIAPAMTGYLMAATRQNWALVFAIAAAFYFFGGACWLAMLKRDWQK